MVRKDNDNEYADRISYLTNAIKGLELLHKYQVTPEEWDAVHKELWGNDDDLSGLSMLFEVDAQRLYIDLYMFQPTLWDPKTRKFVTETELMQSSHKSDRVKA